MKANEQLAKLLVHAASRYASQRSTRCRYAECAFEASLLSIFKDARKRGVEIQDIAVITSVALAALLTKPDGLRHTEELHLESVLQ